MLLVGALNPLITDTFLTETMTYTFVAEDLLQSCAVNCSYFEGREEWDKLDSVMELFKYIKLNAKDGMVDIPANMLKYAGLEAYDD